jgi:hypothetical protein
MKHHLLSSSRSARCHVRTRQATRIGHVPLITVKTSASLAGNVNGPALIRMPDWVQHPLGRYYLYFANHKGKFIRLVYRPPWKIYEPGVLQVKETAFTALSPIHPETTYIRMSPHRAERAAVIAVPLFLQGEISN